MKNHLAAAGLSLAIVAFIVPTAPAAAQYRQSRTETERRECRTTSGFGSTRLPRAGGGRSYQTRTCQIEMRCPGVGDRRACFRVSKRCEPWPGTCGSR